MPPNKTSKSKYVCTFLLICALVSEVFADEAVEFEALKSQVQKEVAENENYYCRMLKEDIANQSIWYLDKCHAPIEFRYWDENREKTQSLLHDLFMLKSDFKCLGIAPKKYTGWIDGEIAKLKRDFLENYVSPTELQQIVRKKQLPKGLFAWKDSSWDDFVIKLVSQLRAENPKTKYPNVSKEADGCGDGEIEVKIERYPNSARLHVINEFSFKVCQARHVDPYDAAACPGWFELLSRKEKLAGFYYYNLTHEKFKPKRGRIDVGFDTGTLKFNIIQN